MHPRNLGNLKEIGFATLENCPSLPSNDEFAKAKSMIGEFLHPLSVELSPIVEAEGNTPINPPKSHSSEVKTREAHKVRVKRKSQKQDVPLPAKYLLRTVDPKVSLLGNGFGEKGPEQEPPRKKTKPLYPSA